MSYSDPTTRAVDQEREAFERLQARLPDMYGRVFPDPLAPRTVVVVPSLSLDPAELAKIKGVNHYEERMLCMLMLLRLPRTRVVYVSSQPIHPTIIDYFLNLLPGVPASHARQRLQLFSCHDSSGKTSLSQKLLARPRLLERILAAVPNPLDAHLACFNATPLERTLALRLGLPLYGCDPDLARLGNKSGSRGIFRLAGVRLPPGFEDLGDAQDVAHALAELRRKNEDLRRAVVKLNDGFSGEGNAIFSYEGAPRDGGLEDWVVEQLPRRLSFEASSETWEPYAEKLASMGGVVEAFLEGKGKRSPSVQCRISPLAEAEVISTHDQALGGPSGQVFLGCSFPAGCEYRLDIQAATERIAQVLVRKSVIGRFGVDFVSIPGELGWEHFAIEINLRKGGTTHPFMMLQFLTDGAYDAATGLFRTPSGEPRYYFASDNLESEALRGLTPTELIDSIVCQGLHFHSASQQGVVFHLMGATSEYGKLGLVCIGDSPKAATALYDRTVAALT